VILDHGAGLFTTTSIVGDRREAGETVAAGRGSARQAGRRRPHLHWGAASIALAPSIF
jgi:hypothetical protein